MLQYAENKDGRVTGNKNNETQRKEYRLERKLQPSLYEHAVYFKFFQTPAPKGNGETARVEKERRRDGGEI